ncbi:amidase [Pararobbsia alpina]|uniref:6-aminohexanoate-cyclic-dimer hydrolase n=1 Tax=Pararobbsia alpina TaxID=621374 RepID=A0A6S7CWJ6_9BURK|nr:amidase [Pararobbsia alpina]CAB3789655.1 6-aminohexanoate-cyclic-dimer hydrolase [Pararobbsia alpina]
MAVLEFDEYRQCDATQLAQWVANGVVSPRELLETAIARAEAVQPTINAITQKHFDLARTAIDQGLPTGPFTGVPFLLKDVSVQMAGTSTSNSSKLYAGVIAQQDSTLVSRYRQAGLVIFGKTNTPEMGLAASTETALNGTTRNPWDLSRTPGGSSGGAAAAVAAGIVPAAQGSDGGGSIRIPASCCGLFGFKPTRARTPLGPFVGEGWGSMASVHVLTRSVRDSAALLDATQGLSPGDPYAAPPVARPYVEEMTTPPGRLRVALQLAPLSGSPVDAACITAARDAARLLESLGHEVEQALPPGNAEELSTAAWALVAVGVAATLHRRARILGRELREDDVEPVTWQAVRHAATLSAIQLENARLAIHLQGRRMATFHERYDIVLSPTLGQVPVALGPQSMSNPDLDAYSAALKRFTPFTSLFNMTGQPSMSVPLHWTPDELPVGVMFSAAFGNDDLLFRLARQLEQARPWFDHVPSV